MRTFSKLIGTKIEHEVGSGIVRKAKADRVQYIIDAGGPDIVFQPFIRLSDMAIVGYEALSRFTYEAPLSPDVWFSDAFEVGLGCELELIAVRKALRAAADLPGAHVVSINLSPMTIAARGLDDLLEIIDPARLVIEITEHFAVADYRPLIAALAPLRAAGVRIAIDDAGAGYSSMRHILFLTPDFIKLDITLTSNIDKEPRRAAMTSALVEFAKRTGCVVVAEGVETQEEFSKLQQLGVQYAQGYFMAKPKSAGALKQRLLNG